MCMFVCASTRVSVCVCVCACVPVCAQMYPKCILGAGVTGGWELPDFSAGN